MTSRYYRPGADGFVVEQIREMPMKDGTTRIHSSYWFGPDHGWGNTWSDIPTSSIAVWPTVNAAFAALETGGLLGRKGTTIRSVADAEADRRAAVVARLDRYLTEGLDHPQADEIIEANREVLALLDEAAAND